MVDRRALMEEALELRAREVAITPVVDTDPLGGSWAWEVGLSRFAMGAGFRLEDRRRRAIECAAVALAWAEACERELELRGRSASRGSG